MNRQDVSIALGIGYTAAKKILDNAKTQHRNDPSTNQTEIGLIPFNSDQAKTWAVFQAAGINREEMIKGLKSAISESDLF